MCVPVGLDDFGSTCSLLFAKLNFVFKTSFQTNIFRIFRQIKKNRSGYKKTDVYSNTVSQAAILPPPLLFNVVLKSAMFASCLQLI
jgi:hypothetical protein